MLERRPLEALEISLCWKIKFADALQMNDYTYRMEFRVGTDLSHGVVFGKHDPKGMFPEYPAPFQRIAKAAPEKIRSDSWMKKKRKSLSWGSSKHSSTRSASSKKESIFRPPRRAVLLLHDSHAAGVNDTPVTPGSLPHDSSDLRLNGAVTSSSVVVDDETGRSKTTYNIRLPMQAAVGEASILSSDEIIDPLASTHRQDFSPYAAVPSSGSLDTYPILHLDTASAILSQMTPALNEPSLLGYHPTTDEEGRQIARSVGSEWSRSPCLNLDSNRSDVGSGSMKWGSFGSTDGEPYYTPAALVDRVRDLRICTTEPIEDRGVVSTSHDQKQNADEAFSPLKSSHSRSESPDFAPSGTRQKTPNPLSSRGISCSPKASRKSSAHSSRQKKRFQKYGKPSDLITPKQVIPNAADLEIQAAAKAAPSDWTWDADANAYWHIDSDTQSRIWYEESEEEDDVSLSGA